MFVEILHSVRIWETVNKRPETQLKQTDLPTSSTLVTPGVERHRPCIIWNPMNAVCKMQGKKNEKNPKEDNICKAKTFEGFEYCLHCSGLDWGLDRQMQAAFPDSEEQDLFFCWLNLTSVCLEWLLTLSVWIWLKLTGQNPIDSREFPTTFAKGRSTTT